MKKDPRIVALKKLNRDHKRMLAAEKHFSGASKKTHRLLKDTQKNYEVLV